MAWLLATSGVVFGLSALIARTMERSLLGPSHDPDRPQTREALRNVVAGLADGARHLVGHRVAAATMGAMAAHRFFYGMATALGIILYRYYFTDGDPEAALNGVSLVVATSGVGYFLAVIITPYATEWFTITRWVPIALTSAGVLAGVLVVPFQEWGGSRWPGSCSAWPGRASRSAPTRPCSATSTTSISAARSPSTTCSSTACTCSRRPCRRPSCRPTASRTPPW
ncbi:hypothetical protein ACFSTC_58030 [Nonomuraea ferruginea]